MTTNINKAAEEGELPALNNYVLAGDLYQTARVYKLDDVRAAIAADRASRQVANKAEVEPVAHLKFWARQSWSGNGNHDVEHAEGLEVCKAGEIGDDGEPAFPVYATPPATTGANTAPRPTDDDLWDATLRDRDAYQEWADKLADAIAKHFGVDIGEHSNQNLPWAEALEAIENAEQVSASTVLTDAQIMQAWASVDTGGNGPELVAFGRAVERLVVAAQAGQVAVPVARLTITDGLPDRDCMFIDGASLGNGTHELYAAPSPAKESK